MLGVKASVLRRIHPDLKVEPSYRLTQCGHLKMGVKWSLVLIQACIGSRGYGLIASEEYLRLAQVNGSQALV